MRNYIKSIGDLERVYYSDVGINMINKTDAPVISTTAGVYNPVYGAQVWAQLNQEANAFGVTPKIPWGRTGWRVITARAASSGGGVAENGAIPEPIKPTFAYQSTKPKSIVHDFSVSEVQGFLATESQDDSVASMDEMRSILALHHREMMNIMLLGDVETLAGDSLESMDRVCSSYSESALLTAATDSDMYGDTLRSSSSSWKDAYVDHNSNVDRDLTDALIKTQYRTLQTAGANPTNYITGHDTMASITGLYSPEFRYNVLGSVNIQPSVNGIQTQEGINVGYKVATVYGWPAIISKNTVQDTLSRLYLLDTSNPENFDSPRLGLAVAKPTQYFEAGMRSGDPFGINALADEGMFRTMAELRCTFFGAQGKVRDLQ